MGWREWQATATPAERYAAHLSMWRERYNRERSYRNWRMHDSHPIRVDHRAVRRRVTGGRR